MQMVFCLLAALLYVGGVAADEPLALHMPDAPPLTLYHDERGHGMVGDITPQPSPSAAERHASSTSPGPEPR